MHNKNGIAHKPISDKYREGYGNITWTKKPVTENKRRGTKSLFSLPGKTFQNSRK
jgi:hypothetical protein